MGLLTELRRFLQEVREQRVRLLPDPSFVDVRLLRGQVRDAARSLEGERSLHGSLLSRGEDLVTDLALAIQVGVGVTDPQGLAAHLPPALVEVLAECLGVHTTGTPTPVDRTEAVLCDWARQEAWQTWHAREEHRWPPAWRYATELSLVRAPRGHVELLAAGEVFLRLAGPDVTRWVLALELLTSLDPQDTWRGHPTLGHSLLRGRSISYYRHEYLYPFGLPDPWNNPTLRRWAALGLLRIEDFRDDVDDGKSATLTELGAEILGELLDDQDTPLKSLARATLEDTTATLVDAVSPPARGRTSASVVRHTRMVAHELRNALVPVRYNYQRLWEQLPRDDLRVALHQRNEAILGGIDRALRFVTDAARAVDAAGDESTFEVAAALRDACVAVEESERVSIEVEVPAANHLSLDGPRARLVLAIVNLLRNAAQAGGSGVRIRLTLARASGHVIVITVDDSGPGVAAERRERLFEADAARARDGRGQGLGLVREVIEDEYGGSVHYEESPLGGARFVLRLPASKETA